MNDTNYDLKSRTFNYSLSVIKFAQRIQNNHINNILINQLVRSATSIGANYEESQAADSRADFRYKINIALKECRETVYWLKLINKILNLEKDKCELLIKEGREIRLILGSIYNKVKK